MEQDGCLIRLFPVPFRLVSDDKQFKKWQWIKARIEKASNDHRPESHKLFVDTIQCEGDPLPTKQGWRARRAQLANISTFDDFTILDQARVSGGTTLGLLRPSRVIGLDITPSDKPDWTQEEKDKLIQHERQGGLFDAADVKSRRSKRYPSTSIIAICVWRRGKPRISKQDRGLGSWRALLDMPSTLWRGLGGSVSKKA
jgi:hypothetical protein